MFFCSRLIFVLTFCIFAGALTAQAGERSYGDFEGAQFIYQEVKENSVTDPVGLLNAPILVGDALLFTPTVFRAEASGTNGIDLTDAALGTLVIAKAGSAIDMLDIVERGDFTLNGIGTDATRVGIACSLFASIIEIDNMPVTDVITVTATMNFSASADGTNYVADSDGIWDWTTNSGTNLWTGLLSLDIRGVLLSRGLSGRATKVLFSLDNTLIAQSEDATDALIAKKQLILAAFSSSSSSPDTLTVVPEPGTVTLILLGLVSLGLFHMKRR